MKSKFFRLSFQDFLKGSIVAILTGLGTFLASVNEPEVEQIIKAAIIALLAYLAKNLFTNSNDQVLKTE